MATHHGIVIPKTFEEALTASQKRFGLVALKTVVPIDEGDIYDNQTTVRRINHP